MKNRDIYGVTLPIGDYSKYKFDGVVIAGVEFHKDSIFCEDTEVFQKISRGLLDYTYLPRGDYSKYNFNGVTIYSTQFTQDSIFSEDKYVF